MKKVLLVCDKPNWAYDTIALSIKKYNNLESVSFDISYVKGENNLKKKHIEYDLIFVLGWQLLWDINGWWSKSKMRFLDFNKVVTGIHSHHSWDNLKTLPEKTVKPPRRLIKLLNKCKAVNAVSNRLYLLFKECGVKNISYTPNGVDTKVFQSKKKYSSKDSPLIVGYSGTLKHDKRKGITEYIEPACNEAGVILYKAMPVDGLYIPLKDMPEFYNKIDVYLCASSSEGFSLSVLEAAACGRAVISTNVGGSEDLIENGVNGYIVDRNVGDIVNKLKLLKNNRELVASMGSKNREIVEQKWSWDIRAKDWIGFIKANL